MRVTQSASRIDDGQSPLEPSSRPRFYLPELDSLRFFAFFAVFIWHLRPIPGWALAAAHKNVLEMLAIALWQAGEFGVDLFFTLSAFLITELLTREKLQFGRINVRIILRSTHPQDLASVFRFPCCIFLTLAILPGVHVPWGALPGSRSFWGIS